MPITAEQMVAVMEQRRLIVRPHPSGNGKWVALTEKESSRLRPPGAPRDGYPTPMDAVEAADAALSSTTDRTRAALSLRTTDALQRARYFIRPRTVSITGPDGNPTESKVFDAFMPDNSPVPSVRGRSHFVGAVVAMEELLGP